MNQHLIKTLDKIVEQEFNDDFDIYEFEKENLYEALSKKEDDSVKNRLNELGFSPELIPSYIVAITSIINVVTRLKNKRKKPTAPNSENVLKEIKTEMEKNALEKKMITLIIEKYSNDIISDINKDLNLEDNSPKGIQ